MQIFITGCFGLCAISSRGTCSSQVIWGFFFMSFLLLYPSWQSSLNVENLQLCFSHYTLTKQIWHRMCGDFCPPARKQSVLQCVLTECPLIEFWHCLPGDSIGSHRFRAQSHETAHHFRYRLQVWASGTSDQPASSWGSHDLLYGFD